MYAGEGQWVEAMVSTFRFLAQTVETQTGRVDHQLLRVETIKYPPTQLKVIADSTITKLY